MQVSFMQTKRHKTSTSCTTELRLTRFTLRVTDELLKRIDHVQSLTVSHYELLKKSTPSFNEFHV